MYDTSAKDWYMSKAVWGGIVAMVVGVLASFGIIISEESESITDLLVAGGSLLGGILALVGRLKAKQRIRLILIPLALLFLVGCMPTTGPIQMDPVLQAHVELAATTTAEFNRRCQAGDPNACSTGLALSSETLDIIVDGLHGEVTP
jgi:hypothetical protein